MYNSYTSRTNNETESQNNILTNFYSKVYNFLIIYLADFPQHKLVTILWFSQTDLLFIGKNNMFNIETVI